MHLVPGLRRAIAAGFPFGFMYGLVAILAQAQANETQAPWYNTEVSLWFYATTLASSLALGSITAMAAVLRSRHLDESIRDLALRLVAIRSALSVGGPSGAAILAATERTSDGPPRAWRSRIVALERSRRTVDPTPLVSTDGDLGTRTLEAEATAIATLLRTRTRRRDSIWLFVGGPVAMCIVYAIISGTMLPGAGGFLQTHFRLNTTLILFIAYTWGVTLCWAILGLIIISRTPHAPVPDALDQLG